MWKLQEGSWDEIHEEIQTKEDMVKNKQKCESSKQYMQTKGGRPQSGKSNDGIINNGKPLLAIHSTIVDLQPAVIEPAVATPAITVIEPVHTNLVNLNQ
jgi:hypothetical protein